MVIRCVGFGQRKRRLMPDKNKLKAMLAAGYRRISWSRVNRTYRRGRSFR